MNNGIDTYEIRVAVTWKGSRHYSSQVGTYIENTMVKMFHKEAKSCQQAMQKCEKYGRPLSARKVQPADLSAIEHLQLRQNPYPDAIALSKFIWRKKEKRAERLVTKQKKDGNGY